ncbi:MAG: PmeII family type II restriction endonuclease [Rhodoferax sp.]
MNQTVLKNQPEVALIESARKFVRAALVSQLNDKLLAQLVSVRLAQLLERENPYWYRIYSAGDVIKRLLDDFLHAKEKALFFDILKSLAQEAQPHKRSYIKQHSASIAARAASE